MNAALAGSVLTRSDFRVPRFAAVDLSGQTVTEVVSRGKHMLTRTDGGVSVHTHFKMEGSWNLYRQGSRWSGGPGHWIRAVLETSRWCAVGYRLAIVEVLPTAEEAGVVGHLGPDLLGADWDLARALANLGHDQQMAIGDVLLDQRNLAGIGNLYKNETLFLSGLNPWTRVADVPDLEKVVILAQRLLSSNTAHWTQTTTGNTSKGDRLWVFERGGRPCRRCGTPVRMSEQGKPGQERPTYWCPNCQPPVVGESSRGRLSMNSEDPGSR
jgi:endonuclease-8